MFDLDDLRKRTEELADFVEAADQAYGLGGRRPIAVGISNGANIAASLLLLRPGILGGGLLIRPMVPFVPDTLPDLGGVAIQINAGQVDPLVPPPQSEALAKLLGDAGATVQLRWIVGGHGLTREDVDVGPGVVRFFFSFAACGPTAIVGLPTASARFPGR